MNLTGIKYDPMAAPLLQIAQRRAVENINRLVDVGDLPWSFVQNILINVNNPAQLKELEENCPQLAGQTGTVWKKLIQADIFNWELKIREPKDPKQWWKVYAALKKQAHDELQQQTQKLRSDLQAKADERARNTTTFTHTLHVSPSAHRRAQYNLQYGGSAQSRPQAARSAINKIKRDAAAARNQRNAALNPSKSFAKERQNIFTKVEADRRAPAVDFTNQTAPAPPTVIFPPSKHTRDTPRPAKRYNEADLAELFSSDDDIKASYLAKSLKFYPEVELLSRESKAEIQPDNSARMPERRKGKALPNPLVATQKRRAV